jgi:hypothetical protein
MPDPLPLALLPSCREYELPASYVKDHFRWRQAAELDLGFEDIIARPEALLRDLASRMGLRQVCATESGRRLTYLNALVTGSPLHAATCQAPAFPLLFRELGAGRLLCSAARPVQPAGAP